MTTRRDFLVNLASATGAVVLLPSVTSCKKKDDAPASSGNAAPPAEPVAPAEPVEPVKPAGPEAPPAAKPADWDAMSYNKIRGAAGAIPVAYLADINGPEGDTKHLGKHLPYQPKIEATLLPNGFIALMWGDPAKGNAKHPNAAKGPANNNEGHWYNWIRLAQAVEGETEELQSAYSNWPEIGEGDNGKYVAFDGEDITADSGKNTIYLAALPAGLKAGDTIRVWAHCLTHGEYVDFLTLS